MRSLSGLASAIHDKVIALTHNNEKHVDDFGGSNPDLSIFDDKKIDEATSTKDMKGAKSKETENTQGIDPIVKTYYEGPKSGNGHYDWVEIPPRQMSKRVAAKLDRIGFKVYKIKDEEKPVINGRFQLKYYRIDIQNPQLVAALSPILKKEGVYLGENEQAIFFEPFKALYFCADQIAALHIATPDGTPLKQQILLLLRVMGDIFGGTRNQVRSLRSSGLISYHLAWIYFRKGMIVYHPGKDTDRIFRVVDAKYEKTPPMLSITCKEVLFDGTSYVYERIDLGIPRFAGNMPITKLDVYPIEFHPDPESVKARLTERGRKVLEYQSLEYRLYKGVGYHEHCGKISKVNVDGRILIDTFGYHKHHETMTRLGEHAKVDPNYPRIDSIEDKTSDDESISSEKTEVEKEVIFDHNGQAVPMVEEVTTKPKTSSYTKRLDDKAIARNREVMEARIEDLMFISPMVKGYCLKTKLWLQFYVEDISPMEWNMEAYEHLVYPEDQKDLVLSFVQHHKNTSERPADSFDDVIKGKGCGLIFLLSGPPGTGKTLTAEAVADRTHRPLLYMHAEDLGVNPATLGEKLKVMFEMATEWNAVCLLDECDVFLSARNPVDIARNELVSIFLREIEYFQGILFLTTNLYDTIDTAFRSRVSIHLRFNPLAPEARILLWQKFLARLPAVPKYDNAKQEGEETGEGQMIKAIDQLSAADLKELSLWELNGREIKGVIKTVKTWCEFKKFDINLARLEAGVKVTAPNAHKRGTIDTSLYDD